MMRSRNHKMLPTGDHTSDGSEQSPRKRIKQENDPGDSECGEGFAWQLCSPSVLERRLVVKERAVDEALKHMSALRKILLPNISNEDKPVTQALRGWINLAEDIKPRHQSYKVQVGVTGVTGAGKTSLLNALLETPELLAQGHEQAATAVACSVIWNHDDTPGRENQALVFLRQKDDVLSDIVATLRAINRAKSVAESIAEDTEDHEEQVEAIAEAEAEKSEGIERIRAVWPDQDELSLNEAAGRCVTATEYRVAGRQILQSNPAVLDLLGRKTIKIYERDIEQLAKGIKPYLDSTQAQHGGDVLFSAWPLLTKVDLYIRAPILRSGIVLVDLPGTDDNVDSRASAQRDYRESLDVTLIVGDIIRAADQKNVRQLMNEQLDTHMRVNRCLFGVILSKTESMNYKSYMKRSPAASSNVHLKDHDNAYRQAESLIPDLEGQRKKNQTQVGRLQEKMKRAQKKLAPDREKLRSFEEKTQQSLQSCLAEQIQLTAKITDQQRIKRQSEAILMHWAISTRNTVVQKRLRETFLQRQQHLQYRSDSVGLDGHHAHSNDIEIMPTSALAFWKIIQDNDPHIGMPTVEYTGVPYIRQWLHRATASRRERHLDIILGSCQAAIEAMAAWQDGPDSSLKGSVNLGHLKEALSGIHEANAERLNKFVNDLQEQIACLDPFKKMEPFCSQFMEKAGHEVARWPLKYPDSRQSTVKLHANTYGAIVRRSGRPYTSRSNMDITYHWPASLAFLFFKHVMSHHDAFASVEIPRLMDTISGETVEQMWEKYITELEGTIAANGKALGILFKGAIAGLHIPKSTFQKEAKQMFFAFNERGDGVYGKVLEAFETELRPVFENAEKLTGPGSKNRKQDMLQSHVREHGRHMFEQAWAAMKNSHEQRKERSCDVLARIAATALRSVENQVTMNLGVVFGEGDAGLSKEVQGRMRSILSRWRNEWKFPEDVELDEDGQKHFMLRDLRIPDELSKEHLQLMEPEGDESADESADESTDEESE